MMLSLNMKSHPIRVDCYGVLGIAREAAATFNEKFCPPVVECKGNDEKASDYVKVTVEDPKLCPRYCARVVKNVKIGPSPKWMQRCLASNGIRPINKSGRYYKLCNGRIWSANARI